MRWPHIGETCSNKGCMRKECASTGFLSALLKKGGGQEAVLTPKFHPLTCFSLLKLQCNHGSIQLGLQMHLLLKADRSGAGTRKHHLMRIVLTALRRTLMSSTEKKLLLFQTNKHFSPSKFSLVPPQFFYLPRKAFTAFLLFLFCVSICRH